MLCDDLDLPNAQFVPAIASSIKQQSDQFTVDMIPEDEEDRRVIIKVREGVQIKVRGSGMMLTESIRLLLAHIST